MRSKFFTFIFSSIIALSSSAQVTIGSDEPPIEGSLLQLKNIRGVKADATNATKGISLPRVFLTDLNQLYPMFENDNDYLQNINGKKDSLDAIHTGLIVYNVNNLWSRGTYTWNGTKWERPAPIAPFSRSVLASSRLIDVTSMGAKGDGTTNDTEAIKAAIAKISDDKGGTIYFPEGTYLVSEIIVPSYVQLIGASKYSTVIKSIPQNNDNKTKAIISLKDMNTKSVTLKNFTVYGDRWRQTVITNGGNYHSTYVNPLHGIYTPRSVGVADNYHTIEDIYVRDATGAGIYVDAGSQELRLFNVRCQDNNEDGFYIGSSDVFIDNSTSYANRGNGYYFHNSGIGIRIINSKAYGNQKNGFHIYSKKTLLSNCSAEENYFHGYHFDQCQFTIGSNLTSDQNSVNKQAGGAKVYCGYSFISAKNVSITNSVVSEMPHLQGNGHKNSVFINTNCNNLYVDLIDAYDMHAKDLATKWRVHPTNVVLDYSHQVSNVVKINGSVYSMSNLQNKMISKEKENSTLSEVFDKMVQLGGCKGAAFVDYYHPSCKLMLTSAAGGTPNINSNDVGVGVSLTVKAKPNQYFSVSVPVEFIGENNDATRESVAARCVVHFKDKNDLTLSTITSSDIEYYNDILNMSTKAPANTTQAEIIVMLIPKTTVTTTKVLLIKDLKYGIGQ